MWYLTAEFPKLNPGVKYFVFTQPTIHPGIASYLVTQDALYAEAFGPAQVEIARQQVMWLTGGANVELLECSTRNILTPEMCRVIGLKEEAE